MGGKKGCEKNKENKYINWRREVKNRKERIIDKGRRRYVFYKDGGVKIRIMDNWREVYKLDLKSVRSGENEDRFW